MDEQERRRRLRDPQIQRLRARWGLAGAEAIADGEPLTAEEQARYNALMVDPLGRFFAFASPVAAKLVRFAEGMRDVLDRFNAALTPALRAGIRAAERYEARLDRQTATPRKRDRRR